VSIAPSNDDILFAAQELPDRTGRLYRSTDAGATWSEVYATSRHVMAVEVSPLNSDLVVLTSLSGAYKSEQGGEAGTWQKITLPDAVPLGLRRVALSPHDEQVYVVGTHDQGFYYTADGGLSWMNNRLEGFFEQRLHQGSDQYLAPEVATAFNPNQHVLNNASVIVSMWPAGRSLGPVLAWPGSPTRAGIGSGCPWRVYRIGTCLIWP
jgi:hypothetical protein